MPRGKGAKAITMKNGKSVTQSVCPTCGTKMFRIGSTKQQLTAQFGRRRQQAFVEWT